jgi:hypothetical protein
MDEVVTNDAVSLGIQLAVSGGLVLLMTIIHSLGLIGITKALHLSSGRLRRETVNPQSIFMIGLRGLLIFLIHIIEIFIFAGFYLAIDAIGDLQKALYYSASAYATLSATTDYFPKDWRLIGALEGLVGFVLIGWSTAFMATTMNELSESRQDAADAARRAAAIAEDGDGEGSGSVTE